jgi:hypothetical protein
MRVVRAAGILGSLGTGFIHADARASLIALLVALCAGGARSDEKSPAAARNILLFSADHGETMMELDRPFTHGYHVCEPISRVPLMLRAPGTGAHREPNRKWVVRVGTDRKLSRWSHYRIREEGSPSHWEMWSDEYPARALLEQIAADPDPGGVPVEMLEGRRLGAPRVAPGLDASTLEKLKALG